MSRTTQISPYTDRDMIIEELKRLAKELDFYGNIATEASVASSKETLSLEETLILKIIMGNKEKVKNIFELGGEAEYKNEKGITLLQLAKAFEDKEMISLIEQYLPKKSKHKPKPK